MFFDDWKEHKKEVISKTILWEYDTNSVKWNWNKMAPIVLQRVLEYGRPEDYYAVYQLYNGKENLREIAKEIPYLKDKELNWCCLLFNLKKEEMKCWINQQSRKKLLSF